jgi:hypothetical protein
MYRIEFKNEVINSVDWSCNYKNRAYESFNDFVDQLDFKRKVYKNGTRKIWITKTDFKYLNFFLKALSFEGIPFNFVTLK